MFLRLKMIIQYRFTLALVGTLSICLSVEAAPQLTVLENGSAVSSSSTIAFGQQLTGSSSRFFQLFNSGTTDLTFTGSPFALSSETPAGKFSSLIYRKGGIGIGGEHFCALNGTRVQCWGLNGSRQFGVGGTTPASSLTPIDAASMAGGDPDVVYLATGYYRNSIILKDGSLRVWGRHYVNTNSSFLAYPVTFIPEGDFTGFDSGVSDVAEGGTISTGHACAVKNGGVWCWGGSNTYGQLGNNTMSFSTYSNGARATMNGTSGNAVGVTYPLPVQTKNSLGTAVLTSGVTAVAAGGFHSCAIQSGALYCWGQNHLSNNQNGQLGIGRSDNVNFSNPQAVNDMSGGVSAVAAGYYHTCAIKNGNLYCWGDNDQGQLGDGTQTDRNEAGAAILTGNVTAVAAGSYHTCAIQNGALMCWGKNIYGQVGNNSTTNQLSPTQVDPYVGGTTVHFTSGISSLSAGPESTCAMKGGTAYCWGQTNSDGSVPPTYQSDTPVVAQAGSPTIGASPVDALHAGASMNVVLTFTPGSTEGNISATATTSTNDAASPHTLSLTGKRFIPPSGIVIAVSSGAASSDEGDELILTGTVSAGSTPLAYEWRRDGAPLTNNATYSGVSTLSLTISNMTTSETGDYTLVVTNDAGTNTATSNTLSVSVTPDFGVWTLAANANGTSADLTWSALKLPNGSDDPSASYSIEYALTASGETPDFTVLAPIAAAAATSWNVASLSTGQRYCFRLHVLGSNSRDFTTDSKCVTMLENRPQISSIVFTTSQTDSPYLIPIQYSAYDRQYASETVRIVSVQYRDSTRDWADVQSDHLRGSNAETVFVGDSSSPASNEMEINTRDVGRLFGQSVRMGRDRFPHTF